MSDLTDDLPVAIALAEVDPNLVNRLRAYVRMWRRGSANGPYLITADNLMDVVAELHCDIGRIKDAEHPSGELYSSEGKDEELQDWVRDTFFRGTAPVTRVRVEARPRHKYIASVIAAADPVSANAFGFGPLARRLARYPDDVPNHPRR